MLSADGKELALFKRANREWVKLDDISPQVIAALIATEDHRFFEHHGIDWRRTASAALSTASGDRQGGSTLTQQLARNLYPEAIGRAPTLTRKLKEAITALKIEAVYTKPEILETYLNTVPFLYNAFGIEMAARTYFDSSADALNLLQSATLIGMLKGNSYYNPVLNPERALQRRNTVLAQMVKRKSLDAAKFESLKKKPLQIDFERQLEPPGSAPHLAQHLRKWLIAWADRNDYDIYSDGLVVRTTIDSRLQALANQAVARQGNQLQLIADAAWGQRSGWGTSKNLVQSFVRETPEYRSALATGLTPEEATKKLLASKDFMQTLRRQKTQVQAGFLALDPSNGQIRAWVGSRDYSQDAYDHVQQARRQPGSTFKPFVYGAAFLQGDRPGDTLIDQAVEIALPGGEIWQPTDHEPPSGQAMSLRDGLVYSKNTITAQLMQTVGAAKVAKLARAMGVRQSKLEAVPSLALGTSPVSLKEMVSAYGTIANGGNYIEAMLVTRIEDSSGQVLEEFSPAIPEAALPRNVAYTLLDVLRGCRDSRHGRGHPDAFWHPRRCRRQDRNDTGQRRRMVYPDAPATGGRRLGRLQRQSGHAAQRLLGPGRAQCATDRRRVLPEITQIPADRPARSLCRTIKRRRLRSAMAANQRLAPKPVAVSAADRTRSRSTTYGAANRRRPGSSSRATGAGGRNGASGCRAAAGTPRCRGQFGERNRTVEQQQGQQRQRRKLKADFNRENDSKTANLARR